MSKEILHKELSYQIIGLAMEVHRELGYGFLEKVYENALMLLLKDAKIQANQQKSLPVHFRSQIVGEYIADIVVENQIVLELKSVQKIVDAHRAQMLNYLKATDLHLGIIINFGKQKLEYERLVL